MTERRTDRKLAEFFRARADMRETPISDRYREWFFRSKAAGLADIEQLTDFIEIAPAPNRVDAWCEAENDESGARNILAGSPPSGWGYWLRLSRDYGTLGAEATLTPAQKQSRRRSDYRLNMIWSGVETFFGGSVAGMSVTDIACNWGGFSIEGSLRGASRVEAFDIRPENIAKADQLVRHFGLTNVTTNCADIFDWSASDPTDIVLNLGLMYHISKPFEMMKKTYEMTRAIAVVDTVVHREAFSGFILGSGEGAVGHAATAVGVELHPTYRALIDLAYLVGFRDIVEIHGLAPAGWEKFDSEPYGNKTRRCIICVK